MEKIIVKTGIYSFMLSFLLLLIGMKRVFKASNGDGMYTFSTTPYPEFFFMITRYSAIITVISIVLAVTILILMKKQR
ncbi:hypothetical protein FGG79_02365 [Bacillus sp. BHET2]|uniref:hypothetical protein n=1 Tax=Bacillus sp. BHET2 TaxID=2583818 RepID=UPI00110F25FB|nr:hypothetical protein [Bacillus sp. BHET2]TMU87005.1 hypothetical protein FGG79_02365 [Bacillus sp. BHET2]